MDPIGSSCLSLYKPEIGLKINGNEKIDEILKSTKSLSRYESTSFRSLTPQIIAALLAASFHIGNGISIGYSAILISQLAKNESDIKTTETENSWIASVLILIIPLASIFCGILMDSVGRLNTIKIAGIPGVLGWSLIAISKNVPTIIAGRLLIGISSSWGTSPGIVYITEIASSKLRMSLMALAPSYVALGMVVTYLGGWYFHWRTLAWICNIFIVLPCVTCMFIHESPAWLIWKEKIEPARKSLNWLHKYQPKPSNQYETYAEMQFCLLQEEQAKKKEEKDKIKELGALTIAKGFLKPTGYRPMIILTGLFFFEHFSGVFVTMFYSITFIEEAGTTINPYFASIMIALVRLVMSIVSIYIFQRFKRRHLMFISSFGMAVCMFVSGLFTMLIKQGVSSQSWIPVMALLFYVFWSTVGLLSIPSMIIAEFFPLEIRGIGYSISYSIFCLLMFGALQSYYTLSSFLGGAANLQWFFAIISLGGMVYCYIFLPETLGMTLNDITEYFRLNWTYLTRETIPKSESAKEKK